MENKQVEQALLILEQVIDAATSAGVFKKNSEAAVVAQAYSIVKSALIPAEVEKELLKKVKK